jgi:hypothetical protein
LGIEIHGYRAVGVYSLNIAEIGRLNQMATAAPFFDYFYNKGKDMSRTNIKMKN